VAVWWLLNAEGTGGTREEAHDRMREGWVGAGDRGGELRRWFGGYGAG